MIEAQELFTKTLKSRGMSLTKGRQAVFESMQGQEPLTVREIIERNSEYDRASVYRTLSLLESLGVIHRIQIGWKYKLELSDSFHHHHHHLTCSNCGRTIPFEEDKHLHQHLVDFAEKHNFTMQNHILEITGLCDQCAVFN